MSSFALCPQCSHFSTIFNLLLFALERVSLKMNAEALPLCRFFIYAELPEITSQCSIQTVFWKTHLQINFSPQSAFSLKYTLNNNTNVYGTLNIKWILMAIATIISFKVIDWSQEIAKPVDMQSEFDIFQQKNNSLSMTNNSRDTKTTCHASNEDRFSG